MALYPSNSTTAQYPLARQISVVYMMITGILGIFSNFLVVIVFVKYEKLRTAANLFILNLAVCDMIISIMDSALSIPSTFYRRWIFSMAACISYGFIHYFFISITVSTLAAISIDRFFHITKPTQIRAWRITRTRALGMLSVIYIYVLLFTFPPLTGWNSFVTEEYFYSGCYINYSDQDPAAIGYSVIASTFLFLAPLIVMIICYHRIYSVVRNSSRKTIARRQLGTLGTPGMRRKYPIFKRTHVQTAKMIIVLIFFCVIVWLPFVVVSLIKAFTGNSVVSPLASHITILVTKSCVVYNVLIYVFLNRKLKSAITLLVCCGKTPKWINKSNKNSMSKLKLSKMFSETDREVPSEVMRNRLSALAAFERKNNSQNSGNSSDLPTPMAQRNEVRKTNSTLSASPKSSYLKNGTVKIITDVGEDFKVPSRVPSKVVLFNDICDALEDSKGQPQESTSHSRSISQVHSYASDQANVLSFYALEDPKLTYCRTSDNSGRKLHTGLVTTGKMDVTKVEARRRAMRKIKQKEAGSRKLPTAPSPNNSAFKDEKIAENNNEIHAKISAPAIVVYYSRENSSSSTLLPSSNNSTMSENSLSTSIIDNSSIDVSPRILYTSASASQRKLSHIKSKASGYRGRATHASLRERPKHSHHLIQKDPLEVSASELQEIRSYWRRMSLCLDDINIDKDV